MAIAKVLELKHGRIRSRLWWKVYIYWLRVYRHIYIASGAEPVLGIIHK